MKRTRRMILAGAAVVAAVVTIGGAVALSRSAPEEYAPAPFARVPADYPHIIPVEGPPDRNDAEGWKRYLADGDKVRRYVNEEGALARVTPPERDAVQTVRAQKYIKGWELAMQVLRADPESVPARYALAGALCYGEKSYPKALFAVREARHVLEKRGRANPDDADSREWYLHALYLEFEVLMTLERFEEALRTVDLLEQTYQPLPWLKVWALLKLDRLDEAEAAIAATEQTGRWRGHALNDRLALENQRRRRVAGFEVGREITQREGKNPVIWSNFGEASLGAFELPQAQAAYEKAVSLGRPNYSGTAYTPLTLVYLQQGRFRDALDARKKGQVQRALRQPHTLQNDQSKVDCGLAHLLLALGHVEEAERLARRVLENPDRLGHNTLTADDEELAGDLLLWTVLDAREQQRREAGASVAWTDRGEQELERWRLVQQVRRVLTAPGRRNDVRPWVPHGADLEPWMLGGILQTLPPGVAVAMVRQAWLEEEQAARQESSSAYLDKARPYFDALAAEAALLDGKPGEALDLAHKALEGLPDPGQKLLRGRVAAVGGEAARRLGQAEESRRLFDQALADFPMAFRLLHLAVPVRIDSDGSPAAEALAKGLLRSPRFRADADGFPLALRADADRVTVSLARNGQVLFQEEVSAGDAEALTAALRTIHQQLVSPGIRLTPVEIIALDDAPAAIKARAATAGVLDKLPR